MQRTHAGEIFNLMPARDAARDQHRTRLQIPRAAGSSRRSPIARDTSK